LHQLGAQRLIHTQDEPSDGLNKRMESPLDLHKERREEARRTVDTRYFLTHHRAETCSHDSEKGSSKTILSNQDECSTIA
jgi:hypothetical protein